jgi:hypothetical protein
MHEMHHEMHYEMQAVRPKGNRHGRDRVGR